jgi:hypothetical protein
MEWGLRSAGVFRVGSPEGEIYLNDRVFLEVQLALSIK